MIIQKSTLYQFFLTTIIFIITFLILKDYNYIYITQGLDSSFKSLMAGDARLYYHLYLDSDIDKLFLLALSNKNLIPPMMQLYLVDGSLNYLYFFFLVSLSIAVYYNIKYIQNNKTIYLVLILISPIVISNLYGHNKEITSYISSLFLLSYILSDKKRFLFFALFFALLTRVEFVVIIILFCILRNIKFIRRKYIIILFLISISIVILFLKQRGVNHIEEAMSTSSFGVTGYLESLNSIGLYIITFFAKVFLNLYEKVMTPSFSTLAGFFTTLSSMSFLILSFFIFKKKKFKLENDIVFL